MSRYVDATEQLVTEIVAADIRRSVAFYQSLGFEILRDAGDFVELTWDGHRLFLAQRPGLSEASGAEPAVSFHGANVRVMVADVDACWALANRIGAHVVSPIGDRHYGLRDFTIVDPDGFGIRFASWLPDR